METEAIEAALEKIRVMLESSKAQQTTLPPLSEKQKQQQKRRWLDQALKLRADHPQLKALEDAVYDFCMDYKKNAAHGRRLVIYGENGTGKSHTAKAVSRWARYNAVDFTWVHRRGVDDGFDGSPRVEFRNWLRLLGELKDGFRTGRYSEELQHLCDVELLILDDVGADNDPNKFGVEHFYTILEARENRWTMITTNIGPEHWQTRFERRVASRLLRNTVHVPLDKVPDYNSL